jgi:hypothetical protein
MSEMIVKIVPSTNLKSLDRIIAEQNGYYSRPSWALYHKGRYTGNWSYHLPYIQSLCDRAPFREYAEIRPGDEPHDSLTEQRKKHL